MHTVQAGEVIDSSDYPGTVQSQKGKWVTVELDAPLPSSNGQFQSTKFLCKETDVTAV